MLSLLHKDSLIGPNNIKDEDEEMISGAGINSKLDNLVVSKSRTSQSYPHAVYSLSTVITKHPVASKRGCSKRLPSGGYHHRSNQ